MHGYARRQHGGSRAWLGLLGRRPDWGIGPPSQRVSAKDPGAGPGPRLDSACLQYLTRKFPMKVIRLPSGSVTVHSLTPLFTVSIASGARPLPQISVICPVS